MPNVIDAPAGVRYNRCRMAGLSNYRRSPMDVERTMQFILEAQARAEVRAERQDLRMQRVDARISALEKRLDRRIDAIVKLLDQGMRMLVRTETKVEQLAATQKQLALEMKGLAAAQKETDRSLRRLLDGLIRGQNGGPH